MLCLCLRVYSHQNNNGQDKKHQVIIQGIKSRMKIKKSAKFKNVFVRLSLYLARNTYTNKIIDQHLRS